jgi:peptidoglycan hydrolase CwlO-like protein/3D (Asp-Asp-Asp) domain-containing protein
MTVFIRRVGGLLILGLLVAALSPRASASDVDSLRDEAAMLAAEVTNIERELAALGQQSSALTEQISATSGEIGVLELQKHELGAALTEAHDVFVDRAVEAYKNGPTVRLALLLSARTMSELLTIAETQLRAADTDAAALARLKRAQAMAEHKQQALDTRQQRLVSAGSRLEEVELELRTTLARRRALLGEIIKRVRELETQARLLVAGSANPSGALRRLLEGTGPSQGIPSSFAGTGVRFEGLSSWYGPGFEGNTTARGDVFDPDLYTAASRDLPLGTWLYVTFNGRGVVVFVNDRGPYIEGRILDLSQAAAEAIGLTGVQWIEAEILVRV